MNIYERKKNTNNLYICYICEQKKTNKNIYIILYVLRMLWDQIRIYIYDIFIYIFGATASSVGYNEYIYVFDIAIDTQICSLLH